MELSSPFDSFVGRERELAESRAALDDARNRRGRLLLLSGEPGIGKTRLAEQIAREASARGMRVVWGRCWEGEGAPAYWPWIQVIRGCIGSADSPERRLVLESEQALSIVDPVAQIVPELRALASHPPRPAAARPDPEEARFQMFDSVARLLKSLARLGPLVIILDDLHDADDASLMMLRFVARGLPEASILMVGTYRDAEVRRSPELSKHVGDLSREARSISLAGLSEAEVAKFVGASSGQTPDDALVARLHEATNGNPLFLDGIVRLLVAENALGSGGASGRPLKIPVGVREAIQRQLGALSAEARALLAVAATIGNEFDFTLCRSVAEVPENGGRRLLEEAMRAGIVTAIDRGRHRFCHALIRDAVYEELDSARRVQRHGKIANCLEELYRENVDSHLAELAHHFRETGLAEKAIDYSVRAGRAAARVFAFADAVMHWENALELMSEHRSDWRRRADLLNRLHAVAYDIDQVKSVEYAESAIALYENLGCFSEAADLYHRVGTNFDVAGQPRAANEHFRRAESVLAKGPETESLARLYASIAMNEHERMNLGEMAQAAQRAMGICERLGNKGAAWSEAASACAHSLIANGKLKDGFALFGRAHDAAVQANWFGFSMTSSAGWYSLRLSDPRAARTWWEQETNRPRNARASWRRRLFSEYSGKAFLCEGQLAEARERLGSDDWGIRFWEGGEWEAVSVLEDRATEEFEQAERRDARFDWSIELGRTYYLLGDYASAEVHLWRGLDHGDRGLAVIWEMRARPWLARLNVAMNHPDVAADQLVRCHEIMAKGENWRGLAGDVARADAVLAAARGSFDIADRQFESALAIHQKYHLPWEQADTLQCWGRALAAAGASARAAEKFDAAIEVFRSHGAAQRFVEYVMADKTRMLGTKVPTRAAAASSESAIFRKEGEFWTVAYQGATFRLKDIKGLAYVAFLIAHPGEQFHAKDLAAIIEGSAGGQSRDASVGGGDLTVTTDLDGVAPGLDPRARADYRRRMNELKSELDEAERFNDIGRAARAREELDFLTAELASAAGIGGRARQSRSHAERARLMVGKNIRAAIEKISRESPALGRHLSNTIRTGYYCSYQPDPDRPVSWQL